MGRAQVGEPDWDRAWQEGQAMSLETALDLAKAFATEQQLRATSTPQP
jgi:hypothetical protein